MTEDPRDLMDRIRQAKERAMTPEAKQRREEVNARAERLQRIGVKPPESGTFGGKPKP